MTWKQLFLYSISLLFSVILLYHTTSYAMGDDEIVEILAKNSSLFESNSIGASVLRYIGWGVTKALAAVGNAAANLYDTCFGFIDFTKYKEVNEFIQEWKPVFIGLVCLSLLLIGILLCIGWEKKPKIVINLLIAVTVVTSSTYVINQLNSFISTDVRDEILGGEGGESVVYNTVGANIHDLLYLEQTVGLQNLNKKNNSEKLYSDFTKQQFELISINETIDPDDVSEEARDIMANGVETEFRENHKSVYIPEELYDGVAWTDLLNEYYYRYTVDWGVMWMELASLIIIYLVMSYKVIRILYEIVVHQILAYLYAANMNNNQKILKILDSLKDCYILLLMTTVLIKIYLLACRFITGWGISGISKGFILLFIAFAVIDGPNLIQKLTGTDIGASDGMGKMISMFYGAQMLAGAGKAAASIVTGGAGAVMHGAGKVKNFMSDSGEDVKTPETNPQTGSIEINGNENNGTGNMESNPLNQQNNQKENQVNSKQNGYQDNNINFHEHENGTAKEDKASETLQNSVENKSGSMDSPVQTNNQQGKTGDGNKSAISSGQSKQSGGYRMNEIGKGMQSQKDALNGNSGGSHLDTNVRENDMKAMEKDIAADFGKQMDVHQEHSNVPLNTGGQLFKNNSEKSIQAKNVFEKNERK